MPVWQRLHPPWVFWRASDPPGRWIDLFCEVCGVSESSLTVEPDVFVAEHAAHRARAGSLGLGDAIARIAKPIAQALGLSPSCTPCERRRRQLNRL